MYVPGWNNMHAGLKSHDVTDIISFFATPFFSECFSADNYTVIAGLICVDAF